MWICAEKEGTARGQTTDFYFNGPSTFANG